VTAVHRRLGRTAVEARATGWRRWSGEQVALWVFIAYLVAAVPILVHIGSDYWFAFNDDWGLILRSTGGLNDLLKPQNEHWSTIPILVFRGLYSVFGVRSYFPYQFIVILLHLTMAALVRVVMRRIGVGPWVATVIAATFVLFGPGYQNYLSAVQVSMVGSMVFGFVHLILADHDGRVDRRDWLGIGAGALGLLCSGVGPVMVLIVGVATLLRRGWKMALLHTVPLGVMYITWYYAYRDQFRVNSRAPLSSIGSWVVSGETGVVLAIAHYTPVAVGLGAVLVVGLVFAWRGLSWSEFRLRGAMPAALLVGTLVLFAAVANERWFLGVALARSSRYVDMGAAFMLPAFGVAADAMVRRWRYAMLPIAALFLVGAPANVSDFDNSAFTNQFYQQLRGTLVGAAYSPIAADLPPDFQPEPGVFRAPDVTMRFLLNAKAQGKLPDAPVLTPEAQADLLLALAVVEGPAGDAQASGASCRDITTPLPIDLKKGDVLRIRSPLVIRVVTDGHPTGNAVTYAPANGSELRVQVPLMAAVATTTPGATYTYCQS
jgi:hypothetical protein